MRLFLLVLLGMSPVAAQNVMDIVHAYSARHTSRYDRMRDYTYQNRIVKRTFNRDGTLKSSTSQTYELLIVNGQPVSRLIERNGRPVSDEQAGTSAQANARFAAARNLEDRFDHFALDGEEVIDGRRTWVVSAKKTLLIGTAHTEAKFWIDEADYECAKSQTEGRTNLISIDGRAHSVSGSTFEFMRVADGVWLPKHFVFRSDAYMPLTVFPVSLLAQHQAHWEIEATYSNYKKFQADSFILSTGEPVSPK